MVFIKLIFQKLCFRFIDKDDINIIWAGNGAYILKNCQSNINIIERHSIHIKEQNNLLQEEYKLNSKNYTFSNINDQLFEYESSSYVMTPSEFVKDSFIKNLFDSNKVIVNPLGCNLSAFKCIEKTDSTFRIITCGIASLRKGIHYLLQAFNELKKEIEIEWWHIGSVTKEMEKLINNNKSKNIYLKGTVNKYELYKYYSQGSVFILPSVEDGFGMVILEAMACGLPVICSENTGIRNILSYDGDEGFIVPIREPKSIKNKIEFLYKNEHIRKSMAKKAFKLVHKKFTWDHYGDRYSTFLHNVLN